MSRVVLEVDVNGEELFVVDKDVLARFCGRIKNLSASARRRPRVVLHGFPGGAEAFELVARFCYAGGAVVTAANACALRCAAEFLDMAPAAAPSLVSLTEKALDEMPHWPWHAVVDAVKQCQRLQPLADATGAFDRTVSALACHVSAAAGGGDATPTSSSPESSAFRFSCDTKSSGCLLGSSSATTGRTWWFDDLVAALGPGAVARVAEALAARAGDHVLVARFLFYYLKCRAEEKKAVIEAVISAMAGLDRAAVSCKGLFGVLRIAAPLHLSAACHARLVAMIGRKLDHATLDNLLVPAPPSGTGGGNSGLYDVGLVLRFVEAFLRGGHGGGADEQPAPSRMKKVGGLVDLYLAEVAPDPSLRPARFVELATALPAAARDSHDALYRAIDVYIQVHHARLTDDDKMKICRGLIYEKLSPECCKHLARNAGFPTRAAVQALASQHTVLKSLVLRDSGELKPVASTPPPPPPTGTKHHRDSYGEDDGQVILYAGRLDLTLENQNLRSLLDGMHWRVMELEKVCSRMKAQMTKMKTTTRQRRGNTCAARSLPRMCS